MRVLLAGASGFVGEQVAPRLKVAGHEMVALTHSANSAGELERRFSSQEIRIANIADKLSVEGLATNLGEIDAIIYLPGLLREFPSKGITFQSVHVEGVRNLLWLASKKGIKRWLHLSALGAGNGIPTGYMQTKSAAEALLRESDLDWTIFRPSVIFDDRPNRKKNFVGELAAALRFSPFLPVFGDGKYRMQPVSLKVVASAVVKSLELQESIREIYELGGPEKFTYETIMRMISASQGKKKPVLHIPFWAAETAAKLLDGFEFFPFTADQLVMLRAENIVKDSKQETKFNSTFLIDREDFASGLKGYFHD